MPRFLAIVLVAASLGGCAYFPTPPDPIRLVDSPADVAACRSLGPVGRPAPTNGTAPLVIASLTQAVPAVPGAAFRSAAPPSGPGFVYSLNAMRDEALARGATDLLLRCVYRDWSYVQGVAYRCRR